MRSFQRIVMFLFAALFACALAQDTTKYDATVYVTSTVYRVNTVTLSGVPTASLANSTSTITASIQGTALPYYPSGNGTVRATGTGSATVTGGRPAFTGAASQLNVNALVALLAAGVGYMAL